MPVRACPMCTLLSSEARHVSLHAETARRLSSPGFPLSWGHVLVAAHAHTTCFADADEALLTEMAALAHRYARILEARLAPARVYVASLGSDREGLAMTTPHLHYHVVPVKERAARPSEVFTWENGVWDGSNAEWDALAETLLA